jgi:hypothetical protein
VRFFMGLESSGSDKLLGGGYVPYAMISAAILWNGKRQSFRKWIRPRIDELFVDSGGFHHAARQHGFPYTPAQLAQLSRDLGASYVATMDLPCEPGVRRTQGETNLPPRGSIRPISVHNSLMIPPRPPRPQGGGDRDVEEHA